MDAKFWRKKWVENDIGFHEQETNVLLKKYFHQLNLAIRSRIFLPLCGKTRDIAWLLSAGQRVVGVELSELAVQQLFIELGIEPVITADANLIHYRAENIDIFVGDIFDLSAVVVGSVDGIYDRAALVALPANVRAQYASHLIAITQAAPQLLICYEYDQQLIAGPPFSIASSEVTVLYGKTYDLRAVEIKQVDGGLKGKCSAQETVWLLQLRRNDVDITSV